MTVGIEEAAGEVKGSQPVRAPRGPRKPQTGPGNGMEGQRFFLAKAGVNSSNPDLGREFATEPEAIVESLRTGLSYFTVSEWRGVADFSGRKPQLRKEAASRAPKTG